MINSTYIPSKIADFEASKLNFSAQGVRIACTAAAVTNLDLTVQDDFLLTGGRIIISGATNGDKFDLSVVDIPGAFGAGPNFVLSKFIFNWYVAIGDSSVALEVPYPAKVYSGLTLRLAYTSTGMTGPTVAINFLLHKVKI